MVLLADKFVIPNGVIVLASVWILGHLLFIAIISRENLRRLPLILAGVLFLVVYLIKPYTYDLEKYSIYFVTGYIPSFHWHTPHDGFQLDPRTTTGYPYTAYEHGFRWVSKLGNYLLPTGSLVPRYDRDYWDFQERGPPRHDAMVLLISILSVTSLVFTTRKLLRASGILKIDRLEDIVLIVVITLGSVYFFIGSQNTIRQFLGLLFVLLAVNAVVSKKYITTIIWILCASLFHRWAIVFGIVATTAAIGVMHCIKHSIYTEIRPDRITRLETLSFVGGICTVILIKGLAVSGAFHADYPLIGDLKAYVIDQDQFQMFERLESWVKVVAIIVLFGLTEFVQGTSKIYRQFDIRLLRRVMLCAILPLAIFPEIFARMLFLYWMIEMVFVISALLSQQRRTKVAGLLVFVAYGFAPNALNILLGPQWLRAF